MGGELGSVRTQDKEFRVNDLVGCACRSVRVGSGRWPPEVQAGCVLPRPSASVREIQGFAMPCLGRCADSPSIGWMCLFTPLTCLAPLSFALHVLGAMPCTPSTAMQVCMALSLHSWRVPACHPDPHGIHGEVARMLGLACKPPFCPLRVFLPPFGLLGGRYAEPA